MAMCSVIGKLEGAAVKCEEEGELKATHIQLLNAQITMRSDCCALGSHGI